MSVAPKTVREQVTSMIRDELIAGKFEVGSMLREVEFANRFGVSRGPVRDAFIQLSHEGFLVYHANRGVMVRKPPNPEDRAFITSIRIQMEVYVIEGGLTDLTDEGIEVIRRTLEDLKQACQDKNVTQIALKDIEFHEAIMIQCGGEDLVGSWRQLCSRMLLTYTRHKDFVEAYEEHEKIFEAIKARKTKRAVAAIKANVK